MRSPGSWKIGSVPNLVRTNALQPTRLPCKRRVASLRAQDTPHASQVCVHKTHRTLLPVVNVNE